MYNTAYYDNVKCKRMQFNKKEVKENNMPVITSLSNTANVEYNGTSVTSNAANTILLLDPTISKTVDKATASVGEVVTYTVTISNPSEVSMSNLTFTDALPAGITYLAGSFEVNGSPATPIVSGNNLTYNIPAIGASQGVVLTFQATVIGGEN